MHYLSLAVLSVMYMSCTPVNVPASHFISFLKAASYGLSNSNAKWQLNSDHTLLDMGLTSVVHIPQLFYLSERGNLLLVVAKVVDNTLLFGPDEICNQFIAHLSVVYKVGPIVHIPGTLKFFGFTIRQDSDAVITVTDSGKLKQIESTPFTRDRRKQIESELTSLEKHEFMSINGSLSFLDSVISPLASFASSHLQQKKSMPTI